MARKSTKADMIAKMLTEGFTAPQIKKRMKVSESYVYAIKKQMEAQETTPTIDDNLSFIIPEPEADTNVDTILDTRANTYGSFEDVANVAQEFKNIAYDSLKARQKTIYADQAEALDMIFSKIARIINGDPNYADSWIDIAGYAKLVADRLEGKVR